METLEEGHYVQGRWAAGRRLNGDDITLNDDLVTLASQNLSGQGLRFGSTPSIVRLTLFRY